MKSKLLKSLIGFGSIICTTSPLISLASCKEKVVEQPGNLNKEYTPDLPQLEAKWYEGNNDTASAVVDLFVGEAIANTGNFKQDLLYTMSRGVTKYKQYLKDQGVKISWFNMNAVVSNIEPKMDEITGAVSIECDLTMRISYDFSKTKKNNMVAAGLNFYKWKTKSVFHMVFDFETSSFSKERIFAKRRQLTVFDGAAQIGISEINSTIQLLSEKGSSTNLSKKTKKIDIKEPGDILHFISPQQDYWNRQADDQYATRLAEIEKLKSEGHYIVPLLIDYYFGQDVYPIEQTPNTMEFGSYHMANAVLKDTFEYGESDTTTNVLYGFNFSNNSTQNWAKLVNEDCYQVDGDVISFTLPTSHTKSGVDYPIEGLADRAFDGTYSTYDNQGLPNDITNVVIPGSYQYIGSKAISFAEQTSQINTITLNRWTSSRPYNLSPNAFYQLPNLRTIDLSTLNVADCNSFTGDRSWTNAFQSVHYGCEELENEGVIYLPSGWEDPQYQNAWKTALIKMGITISDGVVGHKGWILSEK